MVDQSQPYDAVMLTSFGGPEGPQDVLPFLRNVVAGRDVPEERLQEVAQHYFANDGVSPINEQNRELVAVLGPALRAIGIDLPVLFGNRNWDPFMADVLEQAARAGHRRVLALVTSAYSSWSGCRQYRENLAEARAQVAQRTGIELDIDKVRVFFNHPGFVSAMADRVGDALGSLEAGTTPHVAFVTHSIPLSMARHSDYVAQHLEACRLVADRVSTVSGSPPPDWTLVYCSRSGPEFVPWLVPDINDHLRALAGDPDGPDAVVVAPIGFLSDHMEVIHDLDVEAAETAHEVGLGWARAATVGIHPEFVAALVSLLTERLRGEPAQSLGVMGPWHDACPVDCCRTPDVDYPPTVASATPRGRR